MNKVITINLNGNAYQLEEDGYEALRAYLEIAAGRLAGNPDRDEIIADIEQAIADKFRAVLGVNKTVVVAKEVEDVIAQMGPVQDTAGAPDEPGKAQGPGGAATAAREGTGPAGPGAAAGTHKRLYRIREGAMVAGVCNGLAAYLGIDVTIIRILFVIGALSFGAGFIPYIVLMFLIPHANTPDEKAAAYGVPSTAEEFIRRAKEGYYGGMKSFGDRKAFREWKWKFKQDMRQYRWQMRDHARQWSQDWHQQRAQNVHPHAGTWVFGSLLGVVTALLTILCVLSVLSLILTGALFGIFLPSGLPVWVWIILVIVFFRLLKWPLKVMHHGVYYDGCGRPGYMGPFACLWHSFGWIIFLFFFIWFADHHSATFHDALHDFRHGAHRAVDSIREWWAEQ